MNPYRQGKEHNIPYSNYNPYCLPPLPERPYRFQRSQLPQQNQQIYRSNTYSPTPNKREQYLWDIFQKVDVDRSGLITVDELQRALVNSDWSPFNIETVRLMVNIFDRDNNGAIDFREFKGLWKYIEDWSNCFKKFDRDNSGSIDHNEMAHALRTFGFNISDRFISILVQSFDKYGNGTVTFDNFVQVCVTLSTLTKSFKARDYEGKGSIIIGYEDFLTLVISSRPNMKGS